MILAVDFRAVHLIKSSQLSVFKYEACMFCVFLCEWAVQFLLLKHVMLVMCPASLILIYEDT